MKKLLSIIFALLLSTGTIADTLTLSGTSTNYDYSPAIAGILFDDSSTGVALTYGFTINPTWSIDVGYKSLGRATRSFGPIQTRVKTNLFTIMANAHTHIGDLAGMPVNLHGMIGIARADIDASVGPITLSDNDVGLAYGAGFRMFVAPHHAVDLSVTKYDVSFSNQAAFDLDPTIIELGYTHTF